MTLHNQLVFDSIELISYSEGIPLFDQRLATLKNNGEYNYKTFFKVSDTTLLIKITNEHVSTKIFLNVDNIKLLEFTSHKTYRDFTIYVRHDDYEKIVFQITNSATEKLKEFLKIQNLSFVENVKLETPQKIAGYNNSGNGVYNIGIFLLIILGLVGLYYAFISIDFRAIASSGIFRFLMYFGIIGAFVIGFFSRLK